LVANPVVLGDLIAIPGQ